MLVANFRGNLARLWTESVKGLRLFGGVVTLAGLIACAGAPSLNPDATATIVIPAPPAPTSPAARAGSGTGALHDLSVDRIAYIGPYGDLFTVNPDGSDERRLTGVSRVRSRPSDPAGPASPSDTAAFFQVQDLDFNESYAWPTWAPDGSRLAVSRVQITPNRSLEVSVQVIDAITGVSRLVYDNDVPGLIADGSPHYLYWSPDGELLSFLATTRQGLTLFAVNPDTSDGAIALERGAPLYYSWSGSGQALIVHSREDVKVLHRPFLSDTAQHLTNAVGFRTPAFSPRGDRWAYSTGDATGSVVHVGEDGNPAAATNVLETGPLVAFMWSPDGQTLAVADNPDPQGRIYNRIRLLTPEGNDLRTLVEESLLAFYWAPDGQRLAWVGVDAEEQVFEWKVVSASHQGGDAGGDNASRELFRFRPSGEVFTMLSFFDQYAYSHSPWSPDGTRLVVAGSEGPVAERRNGHTPTGASIYVLDAVGDAPPAEIAQGNVAFWSWN